EWKSLFIHCRESIYSSVRSWLNSAPIKPLAYLHCCSIFTDFSGQRCLSFQYALFFCVLAPVAFSLLVFQLSTLVAPTFLSSHHINTSHFVEFLFFPLLLMIFLNRRGNEN